MTTTGRGCCARCGAWLRRARPRAAELCDPCRRVGPDPRRELPAGFYFQDPIVAALAAYDFGLVFRRVRAITGWSPEEPRKGQKPARPRYAEQVHAAREARPPILYRFG